MYDQIALVKPEMLMWARGKAGLTLEMAEKRIRLEGDLTVALVESGAPITMYQLRRFSTEYRIPLAMFYLPDPPQPDNDLRVLVRVLEVSVPGTDLPSGYAYDLDEVESLLPTLLGEDRVWADHDLDEVVLQITVKEIELDNLRALLPLDEVI